MKDYLNLELEELLEREDLDFENDGEVQYAIGLCYKEGKGIEVDFDQAEEWFKKAKSNGYFWENENTIEHSNYFEKTEYSSKSMLELAKLSEEGNQGATIEYAKRYCTDLESMKKELDCIDEDDYENADFIRQKYELLANQAQKEGKTELAEEYYGTAIELDSKEAEEYYVQKFLSNPITNERDFERIKLIARRDNDYANYILGRASVTAEWYWETYYAPVDQIRVNQDLKTALLCFDKVINSDEVIEEYKYLAEGYISFIDENYSVDFTKWIDEAIEKEIKGEMFELMDFGLKYLKYAYRCWYKSDINKKIEEKIEKIIREANLNDSFEVPNIIEDELLKYREFQDNVRDQISLLLWVKRKDYEKSNSKKHFVDSLIDDNEDGTGSYLLQSINDYLKKYNVHCESSIVEGEKYFEVFRTTNHIEKYDIDHGQNPATIIYFEVNNINIISEYYVDQQGLKLDDILSKTKRSAIISIATLTSLLITVILGVTNAPHFIDFILLTIVLFVVTCISASKDYKKIEDKINRRRNNKANPKRLFIQYITNRSIIYINYLDSTSSIYNYALIDIGDDSENIDKHVYLQANCMIKRKLK